MYQIDSGLANRLFIWCQRAIAVSVTTPYFVFYFSFGFSCRQKIWQQEKLPNARARTWVDCRRRRFDSVERVYVMVCNK